ncbi:unnamed protein product [Phytophthora fragariaefolia]|uniref:Unnamed protein product n=1 Tax=Phytophthora fragariaefolia TaxID=1490495 RepID=A0A9W6XW28_9STRA|nr:unnamed protein product [Phytophthora fragariaefolia]
MQPSRSVFIQEVVGMPERAVQYRSNPEVQRGFVRQLCVVEYVIVRESRTDNFWHAWILYLNQAMQTSCHSNRPSITNDIHPQFVVDEMPKNSNRTRLRAVQRASGTVVAAAAAARVHRSTWYRWKAAERRLDIAAKRAPNKHYMDPRHVLPCTPETPN